MGWSLDDASEMVEWGDEDCSHFLLAVMELNVTSACRPSTLFSQISSGSMAPC